MKEKALARGGRSLGFLPFEGSKIRPVATSSEPYYDSVATNFLPSGRTFHAVSGMPKPVRCIFQAAFDCGCDGDCTLYAVRYTVVAFLLEGVIWLCCCDGFGTAESPVVHC